jgi:hypothetical protein
VHSLWTAAPLDGPETFPKVVAAAMEQVDHTIFFSRIGDQVRFASLPGRGTCTMTYALDAGYLASDFAPLRGGAQSGRRLSHYLPARHRCLRRHAAGRRERRRGHRLHPEAVPASHLPADLLRRHVRPGGARQLADGNRDA